MFLTLLRASLLPHFLLQAKMLCCAAQVRNASEEDINRSRLARGLAMATLLWVVCAVLGIPFKFALTLAFMAVGGMMLKEFAQGRASGSRVGGRGPHGGVKTTVRLPEGPRPWLGVQAACADTDNTLGPCYFGGVGPAWQPHEQPQCLCMRVGGQRPACGAVTAIRFQPQSVPLQRMCCSAC